MPLAGHPPPRTVLALLTHTALRYGLSRFRLYVVVLVVRIFRFCERWGYPHDARPYRRLLSSSGIARLLRYYEAIRLPMADNAPSCLGLVAPSFP